MLFLGLNPESKRSRSWSRSRYFRAGVGVGVAWNSSTPQPCSEVAAEQGHSTTEAKKAAAARNQMRFIDVILRSAYRCDTVIPSDAMLLHMSDTSWNSSVYHTKYTVVIVYDAALLPWDPHNCDILCCCIDVALPCEVHACGSLRSYVAILSSWQQGKLNGGETWARVCIIFICSGI